MKIDLHTHSTISDGEFPPDRLVLLWDSAGLDYASLNDHDTIDGLAEAEQASLGLRVRFIPGIEVGCRHRIHILGEGVNYKCKALCRQSDRQKNNHRNRARIALDILDKNGFAVDRSILKKKAGIISTYDLYLASNTGLSSSEFARRWIYKGSPHYVKIDRLDFREAIELIHEAEGIAVWAHPGHTYKKNPEKIGKMMLEMKKAGLDAVEVFSSKHTCEQTAMIHNLAQGFGLPMTGGSDYHGRGNRVLGGYDTFKFGFDPEEILEIIKKKTAANIC